MAARPGCVRRGRKPDGTPGRGSLQDRRAARQSAGLLRSVRGRPVRPRVPALVAGPGGRRLLGQRFRLRAVLRQRGRERCSGKSIGTAQGLPIVVEDCSGCGLAGWGWQDPVTAPTFSDRWWYFAVSGPQTIRIQGREDGISIDQIVLSPVTYLNQSPGSLKNDTTILPESGSTLPSANDIVKYASGAPVRQGTWRVVADAERSRRRAHRASRRRGAKAGRAAGKSGQLLRADVRCAGGPRLPLVAPRPRPGRRLGERFGVRAVLRQRERERRCREPDRHDAGADRHDRRLAPDAAYRAGAGRTTATAQASSDRRSTSRRLVRRRSAFRDAKTGFQSIRSCCRRQRI